MARKKQRCVKREATGGPEVVVGGMDVQILSEIAPWDWPRDAGEIIRRTLMAGHASLADRLLAAELAGNAVVADEAICGSLMEVAARGTEPEELCAMAAISLGPVLETMEDSDADDPFDEPPVSAATFHRIQAALRELHDNLNAPKLVRRRSLEAAVRSPMDWQRGAIGEAWSSEDKEWVLTAVFGMRYLRGFEGEILKALDMQDENIRREAILAAGNWEVTDAGPRVVAILRDPSVRKNLRLAAIEAVGGVAPDEAEEILHELSGSDDAEIEEAVDEALLFLTPGENWDDDEESEFF